MTCFITYTVLEIQYSILYRYNDQLLIEDVDRNTHVWIYRYLNTIIIINDYWEIEEGSIERDVNYRTRLQKERVNCRKQIILLLYNNKFESR